MSVEQELGRKTCHLTIHTSVPSPFSNLLVAAPSSTFRTRWAKLREQIVSPSFFLTGAICVIIKVLLSPPGRINFSHSFLVYRHEKSSQKRHMTHMVMFILIHHLNRSGKWRKRHKNNAFMLYITVNAFMNDILKY